MKTTAGSSTLSAPNHGFANNAAVKLLTSSSLPAPLNTTTTYYVRDVVTGSSGSFKLATTVGGTAITITGAGSGTQSVYATANSPTTLDSGYQYVPAVAVSPTYDDDGNLLTDVQK